MNTHVVVRREDGTSVRMRLKSYQIEKQVLPFLRALYAGEGQLWEKTRQMYVTTTFAALYLWALQYVEGFTALAIARVEGVIDDGGENSTWDSFFGKMRFMWERLPLHLRHAVQWKYLTAVCPARESFVVGESASPSAGRSGRYRLGLWDEAAHTMHDEAIWASFSSAVSAPLVCSTPHGKDNTFYWLRSQEPPPLVVHRIHWRDDPDKDDAWYEAERRKLALPHVIAQELDISYEGSLEGRIYPEFAVDTHVADIGFDYRLTVWTGWDFGIADPTSVVWCQVTPDDELRIIDEIEDAGKIADYYAAETQRMDREETPYPRKVVEHWGDTAGSARNSQGGSWIADLAVQGIHVRHRPQNVTEGVALVRRRMVKGRGPGGIVVSRRCKKLIAALEAYRWDPRGKDKDVPLHDWTSHLCDALRYAVVGRFSRPLTSWGSSPRSY
jgi:hypothetical protein